MIEDDTFNALKRLPFNDMCNLVIRFRPDPGITVFTIPDELFLQYGWTRKEFILYEEMINDRRRYI